MTGSTLPVREALESSLFNVSMWSNGYAGGNDVYPDWMTGRLHGTERSVELQHLNTRTLTRRG